MPGFVTSGTAVATMAKLRHGTIVAPAVPDGCSRWSLTLDLQTGLVIKARLRHGGDRRGDDGQASLW